MATILSPAGAAAAGLEHRRAWCTGEIDYGGGAVLEEWWWHGILSYASAADAQRVAANLARSNPLDVGADGPQAEVCRVAWREPCECECGAISHEVSRAEWIVMWTNWEERRDAKRTRMYPLSEREIKRERGAGDDAAKQEAES